MYVAAVRRASIGLLWNFGDKIQLDLEVESNLMNTTGQESKDVQLLTIREGNDDFASLRPKPRTATAFASTANTLPPPAAVRGIAQQLSSSNLTIVGNSV